MGAIVLEPGTSMSYFVNVRWGLSERPFLLVIPAKGELAYVSPGFEEQRAREITKFTQRRARVAGRRGLGRRRRGHPEGPRRCHRQGRRRRARAVFHPGRPARRLARGAVRPGHAGHRGMPPDQRPERDRADAARERPHHRRVQRGVRDAARRHDAVRVRPQRPRRVRRPGRAGRLGRRAVRPVHGVPARQHHAAAAEGRRRRARRRRLQHRGLPVRHHAHDGVRQAVEAADRRLESRESRTGGGVRGGASWTQRASRWTRRRAR